MTQNATLTTLDNVINRSVNISITNCNARLDSGIGLFNFHKTDLKSIYYLNIPNTFDR